MKRKQIMTAQSSVQVIFGTGPLGRSVMNALVSQGIRVRMVNRSGQADLPQGVELAAGDAYQPEFVRKITRDADVVYMCAQPAYHQWVEKFPVLMESILDGMTGQPARFVFGDNLYMYGEVNGPIHEGLPYAATTRKGQVRAKVAEMVQEAHRLGRVQATIGRGADFFGPYVRESAMGERAIFPAIQGKTAQITGDLDQVHTYTFIEDFGKALTLLGEQAKAFGQVWHVPNAPAVTQREFMNQVFREIGLEPKMSGMGKIMMWMGGLFIPAAKETLEMMYEFEKPFLVDSTRFEKTFGMSATPLEESIHQTVSWYREALVHPAAA
jgi:nucleoside-diphosphate-sugar epimerase